jgi:bifunctional DNA-binding transcriptional regulator/antitoxin component of YhaV-PrlF toxin-antitoxin module
MVHVVQRQLLRRSGARCVTCIPEKNLVSLPAEDMVMKTTVTARGQTVVPAKIRKDHQISARTQLEWLDDGETIRVIPLPPDAIRAARGLSTGLRQRLLAERERERQRG